ncbi:MAG TPA: hypothetical protein VHC70_02195 [Phycisphaerales bacterium]|nr:hypothetical protein [Phycisphaerales bacterium]
MRAASATFVLFALALTIGGPSGCGKHLGVEVLDADTERPVTAAQVSAAPHTYFTPPYRTEAVTDGAGRADLRISGSDGHDFSVVAPGYRPLRGCVIGPTEAEELERVLVFHKDAAGWRYDPAPAHVAEVVRDVADDGRPARLLRVWIRPE